jgi:hypothetical protein
MDRNGIDIIHLPQFQTKNYLITSFGAQSGGVINAAKFKKAN